MLKLDIKKIPGTTHNDKKGRPIALDYADKKTIVKLSRACVKCTARKYAFMLGSHGMKTQ